MNLEITPELAEMRASVRRFTTDKLQPMIHEMFGERGPRD